MKFNNITAIFPKVNVWFVGKEFKYNSSLGYKGQQIDLSVYKGRSSQFSKHTELSEKYLIVQLKSNTEMDLELVDEIYFKISAIFSFFIDKYVSYTHYELFYFHTANRLFVFYTAIVLTTFRSVKHKL
ncbi:hypothetical protein [Bacillus bingmayongensis]|uniref:hypothetical protein n=1 Tax=Bacillus bingmayongensis TaxID=1150157 RepID=UPI0035AC16B7